MDFCPNCTGSLSREKLRNVLTFNVNGGTQLVQETTTIQNIAFSNLEKATNIQHIAITEAKKASRMVEEYWTILQTCEEAD